MPNRFDKDPDAKLNYMVDWTTWLDGDTIATSEWLEPVPTGVTTSEEDNDTTTATIVVEGGTDGVRYEITNRITTASGLIDDRSIFIDVKEPVASD